MIILDTNVLSELMRTQPNPGVMAWIDAQSADGLFISAITMAEILHGIARLPASKRKDHLHEMAWAIFSEDFADRVLPFDAHAASRYAQWVADSEAKGKPVSMADAQIAAICQLHNASLATRNVKDFAHGNVSLINPWLVDES